MKRSTQARKLRAFTLIELLVVVAIIALLLAILVPTLSQARSLSRRTLCLANLQGQGRVLTLYDSEQGRYPIGQREQIPGGWPALPYSNQGEWSRPWSSSMPSIYSRGDMKFDLRRNLGDVTYSNASLGGSGKLWVCPSTTPQFAPYQVADDPTPGTKIGYLTGPRYWYYSTYLMMWSEPGNRLDSAGALVAADSKWVRVISGSGVYAGPVGPKNARADVRMVLMQDVTGYEIGGSAQVAYSNHAKSGATNYGGLFVSGNEQHYLNDSFTAPAATYAGFIGGANLLFNDGHAEFVRTSDLTPVQINSVLQRSTATATVLLTDLTEAQR